MSQLSIPLNGTDFFHYALSRSMEKQIKFGNVCSLAIILGKRLSEEKFRDTLNNKLSASKILLLRFREFSNFFQKEWQEASEPNEVSVKSFDVQSDQFEVSEYLPQVINLKADPPFHFTLLNTDHDKTILIFSWHHALMDARGAETFLHLLGSTTDELSSEILFPQVKHKKTLHSKYSELFSAKKHEEIRKHLFESGKAPIATVRTSRVSTKSIPIHHCITFSSTESERILDTCRDVQAGLFQSAVFLAASARAVRNVLTKRSIPACDFHIPVPHSLRRRSSSGPLVTNQVSVLFYRIPADSLNDLKSAAHATIDNMHSLIGDEKHIKSFSYLECLTCLPLSIYSYLLKLPTKGEMASFYFSDIGDSLERFGILFGATVEDALHYPPCMYPSGLTIVFARFRGRIRIFLSTIDSSFSREDIKLFETTLREDLCPE